jgi:hypothetical protein
MEKFYQLYFNKDEYTIKIAPLQSIFKTDKWFNEIRKLSEGEIKQYNQNYYFAKDRKALEKFALQIKEEWVREAQEQLDKVNSIKV